MFRIVEWWVEALNKDGFQLSIKLHDVHVIGARLCRLCKGRLSCHSRLIVIIYYRLLDPFIYSFLLRFSYYWLLVTQFPMVQPICPLVRITELCLLFHHQFKGELQSQFFVWNLSEYTFTESMQPPLTTLQKPTRAAVCFSIGSALEAGRARSHPWIARHAWHNWHTET